MRRVVVYNDKNNTGISYLWAKEVNTMTKSGRITCTMFDEWCREQFIRKTLSRLSQQRVRGVIDNHWVVEKAVSEDEGDKVVAALRTCNIRGWVELLYDAVPHDKLTPEGKLPEGPLFSGRAPIYKLTEAGWSVIHRSHEWVVATFAVAACTLIATVIGIFITVALT